MDPNNYGYRHSNEPPPSYSVNDQFPIPPPPETGAQEQIPLETTPTPPIYDPKSPRPGSYITLMIEYLKNSNLKLDGELMGVLVFINNKKSLLSDNKQKDEIANTLVKFFERLKGIDQSEQRFLTAPLGHAVGREEGIKQGYNRQRNAIREQIREICQKK